MQRRGLLKAIAGLLMGAPVLSASARVELPTAQTTLLTILDTRIAGFAHYQGEACLPLIQPGDALTLKREPENKYDRRAIEVYWRQFKIGHVPRLNNRALSRLMDQGYPVSAMVKRVDDGLMWEPLYFEVGLRV